MVFAQLGFYVLTVGAVFVLRRARPTASRPVSRVGLSAAARRYIVAASAMMIDLLILKPHSAWPGLVIALSGVPIYCWTTTRRTPAPRIS